MIKYQNDDRKVIFEPRCLSRWNGTKGASWTAAALTRARDAAFHTLAFPRLRPCGKKGRNCETNPISFKTYYPPNTNNEEIFFLLKSKSYDV
jgi:hypothetical protein